MRVFILLFLVFSVNSFAFEFGSKKDLLHQLENQPKAKDGYHCVNTRTEDGWDQSCQLESDYIVDMGSSIFECKVVGDGMISCKAPTNIVDENNLVDKDTGKPYNEVCDSEELYTEEGNEACKGGVELPYESVTPYVFDDIIQPEYTDEITF